MYKIGQKIWRVQINKIIEAQSDLYKNGITIEEFEIIGINQLNICINDLHFTSLSVEKSDWKSNFDDISVSLKLKDDYFGKGVISSVYSTKKPNKALLKKIGREIDKKIKKQLGLDELKTIIDNFNLKQWEETATTSKQQE